MMKRIFIKGQSIPLLLAFLLLLIGGNSCVKDNSDDCGLTLRFRYVYNMQEADGLSRQANSIKVWVFDAEEKLVVQYQQEAESLGTDHTWTIPNLPKGSYTFVAMAKSTDQVEKYADFEIPDLEKGDSIGSLTARLSRDERGVNVCPLNTLLLGKIKVQLTGGAQTIGIDLMKCTNTIRVILLPMTSSVNWMVDDFEIYIEGKNGWLAHDGSPYRLDRLIYRPYYQNLHQDDADCWWVAEMNTSRLMYDLSPRLVVRHRKTQSEILNINLTGLLSLQAIGEHQKEWSHQEYLDRQDEYALTFIIDGCTWMQTKIVVNGWVLSLEDIGL